jgi:hypothetical protein
MQTVPDFKLSKKIRKVTSGCEFCQMVQHYKCTVGAFRVQHCHLLRMQSISLTS